MRLLYCCADSLRPLRASRIVCNRCHPCLLGPEAHHSPTKDPNPRLRAVVAVPRHQVRDCSPRMAAPFSQSPPRFVFVAPRRWACFSIGFSEICIPIPIIFVFCPEFTISKLSTLVAREWFCLILCARQTSSRGRLTRSRYTCSPYVIDRRTSRPRSLRLPRSLCYNWMR